MKYRQHTWPRLKQLLLQFKVDEIHSIQAGPFKFASYGPAKACNLMSNQPWIVLTVCILSHLNQILADQVACTKLGMT